jgi:hypothetical protein
MEVEVVLGAPEGVTAAVFSRSKYGSVAKSDGSRSTISSYQR